MTPSPPKDVFFGAGESAREGIARATAGFTTLRTIDAHAGGEPLRIVLSGWPEIPGESILARRAYARAHHELYRRALMWEPRGHADMYGAIPTPPVTPDGDLGVLFIHNEGYSTMCGHGIIALTKVALDCGLVRPRAPGVLQIDTPAGRVTARARVEAGRAREVSFVNVPSFVAAAEQLVDVPGLGAVRYTLAYGGAFYAYVDAAPLGLSLEPSSTSELIAAGRAIKRAVSAARTIEHPSGAVGLGFLYGTIFVGPPRGPGARSRNVCVFADGEVDRSPTGTGVSGRAAIEHARGELAAGGDWIRIESILGTHFDVRVRDTIRLGSGDAIVQAVIPEVRGTAHITGRHEFLIDPDDPLRAGVLLR